MSFKPTSPDELNTRITIQHQAKVADGMGGFTTTWTDSGTVWAAIWPVSANEVIQANASTMVVSHRIRVRYRNILKANWRIKYADRYFNIVSIIDQNMAHEWLDLMCKEAAS
jgi:SPP1 family predicted phage head-tail adaptor